MNINLTLFMQAAAFAACPTGSGAVTATPADGVERESIMGADITAGTCTGVAICTVPRCVAVFEIRILMPFSDAISIESTDDSSIISISFFT